MEIQQLALSLDTEQPAFGEEQKTLEFVYSLHATLNIQTILQHFFHKVRDEIHCASLNYRQSSQELNYTFGENKTHQANYKLTVKETYLGDITVTRSSAFNELDLLKLEDLLCFLINPLSNGLNHLQAIQSSLHDPLTGLLNRTSLKDCLPRETELARRYESDLAILLLDIDHFKAINDRFGHSAGDSYLIESSKLIQQVIRETDIAFRYGGEEFLILLSKTDLAGAKQLAQRLISAIKSLECTHQSHQITTTLSIGAAEFTPADNHQSLIDRADHALYRAKEKGRDQVCG